MKLTETYIPGLFVIEPDVFHDKRGYFFESFSVRKFEELTGLKVDFVQDNESLSGYGTLRGLHMQTGCHAQAKLVRVVSGRVLDVAVDLRDGSPTYGRHFSIELSGQNHLQMFIPKGFAHGFAVLSDTAVFQYKCDEYYAPESEAALLWDDPDLAIDWKLPLTDVIVSDKDGRNQTFKEYLDRK